MLRTYFASLFVLVVLLLPHGAYTRDLRQDLRTDAHVQSLCLQCSPPRSHVEVYFSPPIVIDTAVTPSIQSVIVDAINGAQRDIRVMAYSFTATPIADALIKAHERGVTVTVILDKSQPRAQGGKMQSLVEAGVSVYIDKAHAIAHNKVIIIDEQCVITGSYNFSHAAEKRNAENVLMVCGAGIARKYVVNFETHTGHGVKVTP